VQGKIILAASVGLVIGLVLGIFISSAFNLQSVFSPSQSGMDLLNPKIFCYAEGGPSSGWFRSYSNRTESDPVVSQINITEVPSLDIQVVIRNNNSISLFNAGIEVSYRTTENNWNTITKTNLGFVDAQGEKHTEITITNPYVSLWQTKRAFYSQGETVWENVTVCTLDYDDLKFTAWGYAEP
jgi:ABC-type transport system involved in multi-copper enzyme maturation permease subunit